METKARAGAALQRADKQIDYLFKKHLPTAPHIFSVPTKTPYLRNFPHENLNTPFERCEIPRLQYMTLISNGERGVGASKGASDWEDEVYGKSLSSTPTPNPVRDPKKPSHKISYEDYKNYKQTGIKPSPKYTATPEQKTKQDAPGRERATSAVSAATPMGRIPSSDGKDSKPVVAEVNSLRVEGVALNGHDKSTLSRSAPTETKEPEKALPVTKEHREPIIAKESNKDGRAYAKAEQTHPIKNQLKHPLPPRPQSPPQNNPEHKKRPLESRETHPDKRIKMGHVDSRTLADSPKDATRKVEPVPSEVKPSHSKPQKPSSQAASSPLPKNTISTTKPLDTKIHTSKSTMPSSKKPLDLPPLLSPLPADLEEQSAFAAPKKPSSEKVTPPTTSFEKKAVESDTIVVKQPTPPKPSPLPFVLPPLLSPDLPDIVEAELSRLQQKSASLNTVEARHEKARLPDAPGVARKTIKPKAAKVGHPPKKDKAERSKRTTVPEREVTKSLIVKIPYKKKQAKAIQRILAITQKPRGQMEKLKAGERLARERSASTASPAKDDSDSEDDVPLSRSRATKTPAAAATTSKKRPSNPTDRSEPSARRAKLPESVDVAKASTPVTPAFKSPALSAPVSAQKPSQATPKKGDAMKSVSAAMRKVDSNDGLAHTPQITSTSTPASAEKPRPNGIEARPHPEAYEKLYPMGTMLKRKMDSLLSPKNREPSAIIADSERKAGLCTGVESLMAYMLAFHALDHRNAQRSTPPDATNWDGFVRLQTFLQISSRQFIELYALIEQIGAVGREILTRACIEHLTPTKDVAKLERIARDTRENSRLRDQAWAGVKRNEKALRDLGIARECLGPWSSVNDAVALAGATLAVYSEREKLEWRPDAQFAAARESLSK